jgi:hypothetical protein
LDREHLISTNTFASIITGDEDDACIRQSLFRLPERARCP